MSTSPTTARAQTIDQSPVAPSRLLAADILRLGTTGLRARPTRALLSALGIAIGIAAMIAVVGISASSQARLNQQLDALGTNLLTAKAGMSLFGEPTLLPSGSIAKVDQIDGVLAASGTANLTGVAVYRSRLIDANATGGIGAYATDTNLLNVTGAEVGSGRWLDAATGTYPSVVLGHKAAQRMGIVSTGAQIWLGGHQFTVVGILNPVALAPDLDSAALVGEPIAAQLFGYEGNPTVIYQRSADDAVEDVRALLPRTINPRSPSDVEVSRPSDALAAKNAADDAFTGLLVGLGSVALLVGGIGVANTMIISVLERRREIGLRRALGATRAHIRSQFLAEALLLSALGGLLGTGIGALVTSGMALGNGWPITLPAEAIGIGVTATLVIGAVAGFYPALRAARTPPTAALNG